MRHVETIIVGAGQAGLALSRELTRLRRDHVVLERGRVGERWRSERWDSLALLTPNWMNALPGSAPHPDADGFLSRTAFAGYLARYANSFGAPVVEGTSVLSVSGDAHAYRVRTQADVWHTANVVVASGGCDVPAVPSTAADAPVRSLHAAEYRRPEGLAPGGVLVVGAGPSGQQIALELRRAGRDVVLAAGRHGRMPRRYRGRDAFAWLRDVGHYEATIDAEPDPAAARRAPSFPLDGRDGGRSLDLGVLRREGVRLTGRLTGFDGERARFADDLVANAAEADASMRRHLARFDAIAGDAPPETVAPVTVDAGPASLDLAAEGIGTILWATGYRRDYGWLDVPVTGADGEIAHRRGVTAAPGVYALGLRFQHHRDSHFVGGVGRDAVFLAERIAATAAAPQPVAQPLALAA